MANGTTFGGQLGKAEGAIKTRKSRLDKMEEEATKLAPDTSDRSPFDGGNLMKSDGSFGDGSFLNPKRRGSNGY